MGTFTFYASPTSSGNLLQDATVSLAVSPTTAVVNLANSLPGTSASGTVNVANTGTVDAYYFVSADWSPVSPTTAYQAAVLANKAQVSAAVESSPAFYTGPLDGLRSLPSPGIFLPSPTSQNVTFTVSLPSGTGNVVQGMQLSFDFLFVAEQA